MASNARYFEVSHVRGKTIRVEHKAAIRIEDMEPYRVPTLREIVALLPDSWHWQMIDGDRIEFKEIK